MFWLFPAKSLRVTVCTPPPPCLAFWWVKLNYFFFCPKVMFFCGLSASSRTAILTCILHLLLKPRSHHGTLLGQGEYQRFGDDYPPFCKPGGERGSPEPPLPPCSHETKNVFLIDRMWTLATRYTAVIHIGSGSPLDEKYYCNLYRHFPCNSCYCFLYPKELWPHCFLLNLIDIAQLVYSEIL